MIKVFIHFQDPLISSTYRMRLKKYCSMLLLVKKLNIYRYCFEEKFQKALSHHHQYRNKGVSEILESILVHERDFINLHYNTSIVQITCGRSNKDVTFYIYIKINSYNNETDLEILGRFDDSCLPEPSDLRMRVALHLTLKLHGGAVWHMLGLQLLDKTGCKHLLSSCWF